MDDIIKEEKIKEDPKIKTTKFVKNNVEENLTRKNIEDIIIGQENSILENEKEIEQRKECIKHYKSFL